MIDLQGIYYIIDFIFSVLVSFWGLLMSTWILALPIYLAILFMIIYLIRFGFNKD